MAQGQFEDGEQELAQDEPHLARGEHDRARYRFGWEAGQRGEYAVHTWAEVEPLLRAGWEQQHRGPDGQVAPPWDTVLAEVRRGWDAARRELEASL